MPGAIYKSPEKPEEKGKSTGIKRLLAVAEPKSAPEPEKRQRKPEEGRLSMPKPEREDSARVWQIRLTPSLITMFSVVMLVTLCFFFLFGIIVGRGYAPAHLSAEPEKLLPDGAPQSVAEAPENVLPPEDLRFMSHLRDQATPPPLPVTQPATPAVSQPGAAATPRPNANVTQPQTPQNQPQAQPKGEISDYVLQAAAFKVESQADALREKLEGVGVRTKLVKEKAEKGTWYKVQVLFRGSPEKLEELRHTMSGKGIKDALVISKKAVS